ncbi:MAG: histidine kinase [Clostridia bacterium]|nr:histidine kinase [Clostridia bacterium]
MAGKIFMSLLLAFGIINPSLFIKLTEFWKFDRKAPTDKVLFATRILCGVAILLIWIML